MADIRYTPEELEQQSVELTAIQTNFQDLFQQTTKAINGINDSWSENLSKNFSGKIQTAQNSFSSILNMLGNGAAAAKLGSTSESSTAVEKCLSMTSSSDDLTSKLNEAAGTLNDYLEKAEDWAKDNSGIVGKIVGSVTQNSTAGKITSGILGVYDKLDSIGDEANEHMTSALEDIVSGDFGSAAKNAGKAMGDFGKYLVVGTASVAKQFGSSVISGVASWFSK